MNPSIKLEDTQNFLRELVFVIFYRKSFIKTVHAAIAGLFLLLAIVLPSSYMCQAKFKITMPQQMDPLQKEVNNDSKNQYIRMLFDQKEIIFSDRVLMKVAKTLSPDANDEDLRETITKLRKKITVAPPKGESFEATNFFILSYENNDPKKAFDISNMLTTSYLEVYTELAQQRSEYSYEFYKKQVEGLYKIMQEKADILQEYEIVNALSLVDILNLESGKSTSESGAKALLTESMRKRQQLSEQYISTNNMINEIEMDLANNKLPAMLPDMEGSGKAISAFKSKVSQLQMQFNEMKTQYTMEYEPLHRLKSELDSSSALLRDEIENYIRGKKIQNSSIKSSIDELDRITIDLESAVRNTAQQRATYDHLKNDYTQARDSYSETKSKLEQARMASSLSQQKLIITMLDQPMMPDSPFKPNRVAIALLGIFLGLFAALSGALILDYFDHSLKNPEDIVRFLDVPCFGSIPHINPEP